MALICFLTMSAIQLYRSSTMLPIRCSHRSLQTEMCILHLLQFSPPWNWTRTWLPPGANSASAISRPPATSGVVWCPRPCPKNCARSTVSVPCLSAKTMRSRCFAVTSKANRLARWCSATERSSASTSRGSSVRRPMAPPSTSASTRPR